MTRVLLTGANGDVGSCLVAHLRTACELRIGIGPNPKGEMKPAELLPSDDVREIDIMDRGSLVSAMTGVEAVVHLAAQRDFYAKWEDLRGPNVDGVFNVFQVAHELGVGKVVFASSTHASGGYDQRQLWPLGAEAPPWPNSLYGVTKAFGEALGRYFAYHAPMSVICLRIGWVLQQPHNEMALRIRLSPGDLCRLIDCSLVAIVQFGIYYGVSANARCKYDMAPARRDLGYLPQDNSEQFATAVLAQAERKPDS